MTSVTRPGSAALRLALGTKIRSHRTSQNLRLIDLVNRTGMSMPKLCRIEYGQDPARLEDIEAIARALGVTVRQLLPRGVKIARVPRLDFGGQP